MDMVDMDTDVDIENLKKIQTLKSLALKIKEKHSSVK
jgi:hypothetical protein